MNEKDIYAISFIVYSNEDYPYKNFENVSILLSGIIQKPQRK